MSVNPPVTDKGEAVRKGKLFIKTQIHESIHKVHFVKSNENFTFAIN